MRLLATCGRIVSSTAAVGTMAALAMALAATTVPAQERGEEREAERARTSAQVGTQASAPPQPIRSARLPSRSRRPPTGSPACLTPGPTRGRGVGRPPATSDLVRETIAASAFAPHQPDPVGSLYEAAKLCRRRNLALGIERSAPARRREPRRPHRHARRDRGQAGEQVSSAAADLGSARPFPRVRLGLRQRGPPVELAARCPRRPSRRPLRRGDRASQRPVRPARSADRRLLP